MDRRAALSKLAVGGATAAAATGIVSQPAFAYTDPAVSGSPAVSITTTGARSATASITPPAGVCPASVITASTPTLVSLAWTTFWPGGNTQMSSGSGANISIPTGFGQWYPDDRIRLTMVYRYQCVYAGSTTEICVRWFREFSSSAFGASTSWTIVGGSSTGPTLVSCLTGAALKSLPSSGGPTGRTADGKPTF